MKCNKCGCELNEKDLYKMKYICNSCGHYLRIPAMKRITMVTDRGSFEEWYKEYQTVDFRQDKEYEEKIAAAKEKTGLNEAVVVGKAKIKGEDVCIGVCDARFLMGSMGYIVGEKVTLAIEKATKLNLPIFMFCCSGGARMQEGIVSLMQMAKTSATIARHNDKGLFYCTILTDPTTGGVTASFAMLGDVIMAEPGATIGFAGQRVIKQTIGQDLPEGFQTAEFQLQHGQIDGIVERKNLKKIMYFMAAVNKKSNGYANFREKTQQDFLKMSEAFIKSKMDVNNTPWKKIKHVRDLKHPSAYDYVNEVFDVFVELKGDRVFGDDRALLGGIAVLKGQPVTVIFEDRGKTYAECVERNFGMPKPEGYRKALRLMKQAEKYNRPIVSFISTLGAYCGTESEERGIGEAIAKNLLEMSKLKVPILAIIIGEAGSGGALATAVGNEVWMFENATYSILSPEGYASIVWKDANRAEEAAEKMQITAMDLKKKGIIEDIIPEFGGASKENVKDISQNLSDKIIKFLEKYSKKSREQIVTERYQRFRGL